MNTYRLNTKLITNMSSVLFMPATKIMKNAKIATTTWYHMMQFPDTITIQQLLNIANGLHIPARRFFSTGKVDFVGTREDYIISHYIDCHYDASVLKDHIDNRRDATWQRAAEAVGMTYGNLRNSLLAIRRTPVIRFLGACHALNIDPFTILIDPNPEPKRGRHESRQSASKPDIRHEIAAMRQDIDMLTATVADLTRKYEELLQAHNNLLHRTNVSIETVNGGHIDIAADTRNQ